MAFLCFQVDNVQHMLAGAADERQPAACVAQQAVVYSYSPEGIVAGLHVGAHSPSTVPKKLLS